MTIRLAHSLLSCAVAATLLTACGGGGGGGNSSPGTSGAAAPAAGAAAANTPTPTPTQLAATPYLKASHVSSGDSFGWTVALSGDGNTLAVGAPFEDSAATTINGEQADNSSRDSGAVYIYVQTSSGSWSLEAYLKAPNNAAGANFGESVALSGDGSTLVVGAPFENGAATSVDGDQTLQTANDAGAVYVFTRDSAHSWHAPTYLKPSRNSADAYFGWAVAVSADGNTVAAGAPGDANPSATAFTHGAANSGAAYLFQRAGSSWTEKYLKAANADAQDSFGSSVALSRDGKVLAVGAPYESSSGAPADNSRTNAGAAYVFAASAGWAQQAYLKASTSAAQDNFGAALALDSAGTTLAVGAPYESSKAASAGAAYVFNRADSGANWSPAQRIKAQNSDQNDDFGVALALSGDGQTLAVGAIGESSRATGVDGDQSDNSMDGVGAAYLFQPNSAGSWEQSKYVKPPTALIGDEFGSALGLSSDAGVLVVSGAFEPSNGTSPSDTSAPDAGAVWVFK